MFAPTFRKLRKPVTSNSIAERFSDTKFDINQSYPLRGAKKLSHWAQEEKWD